MNIWGRGSPRFPLIQQVQAAMELSNYETFPFQNPAWDLGHAGFNPICNPVAIAAAAAAAAATAAGTAQGGEEYAAQGQKTEGQEESGSPLQDHASSQDPHDFWEYKPPGTEYEEEGAGEPQMRFRKEEGGRRERRDRDRHRDMARDRNRHQSRDKNKLRECRETDSPRRRDTLDGRDKGGERVIERDGERDRDRRSPKERRDRQRDLREDDPSDGRGGRRSRERRERSPKEKRKRDEEGDSYRRGGRERDRERDRDEDGHHKRFRGEPGDRGDSRYSLEAANYRMQTPNETVMIRGLAQHITENDIRQDILQCGMMPKDIRLIRKKETGASRGFAFVEFNSTEEARYWMEMKQGVLMFQDQYRAVMQFSIISNDTMPSAVWLPADWDCPKCYAHNFKKRLSCFKCHAPRPGSADGLECANEVSPHPTTKLILRNLDVLTNEEALLKEITVLSTIPIQSCQIGRDSLTNLSKGVCYLEMKNVLEAIKLFNALTATDLNVDGRKVNVSYCKLHMDRSQAAGPQAMTQQQWAACGLSESDYTLQDVPRLAEYSAQMYATTPQEHATYLQYYTKYYTSQLSQAASGPLPSGTGTNAAAAVAQSAIKQAQSKKAVIAAVAAVAAPPTPQYLTSRQLIGNTAVSEPDVASYTYDETSGYFFDAVTGLYYDGNSQYYYHSQDQIFLYWDSEKRAYMPAPTGQNKCDEAGRDDKKKDKEKGQDKVKVAKRIAKDMERWAKTLNQKKEVAKMNAVAVQQAQAAAKMASTADVAFAVLERKEVMGSQPVGFAFPVDSGPPPGSPPQSNLVASYGGGSDSDEAAEDSQNEDKYTDWSKMACLLCKRQFPTKEALVRHQQLSDLHKQNLEAWSVNRGGFDGVPSKGGGSMYRDRAKERRQKFGIPDEPKPNRLKEKYLKEKEDMISTSYEEPTRAGIPSENVGSKMLQKMGWSEGMGLGRSNQGRTDIIQATQRVASAGLGAKGSALAPVTPTSSTSYKDNVKRAMMARYSELDG